MSLSSVAGRRSLAAFQIASPEAEDAVLRAYAADSCDDRVSEDIVDVEDEYAEVAIIESGVARSRSLS